MSSEQEDAACLEFLNSDMVALKTPGSTSTFKIHKGLLEIKSKVLAAAFGDGFSEGKTGVYTCSDTTDGTIARFIQWAYRGDYPASLVGKNLMQTEVKPAEDSEHDTEPSDPAATDSKVPNTEFDSHPLLAHLRLYIFSEVYLIASLKRLTFERLTACLVNINQPHTLAQQRAVVAVLRLGFLKIPPNDSLLDWLAHYAAYCVNQLRLQPSFHDLLEAAPALGSRMMNTLTQAASAPWNSQTPKHRFPGYNPGSYEDGDDY